MEDWQPVMADTRTDTKRVKIGGGGVVADYAWLPLKIIHFEGANAAINGRFRPAPPILISVHVFRRSRRNRDTRKPAPAP